MNICFAVSGTNGYGWEDLHSVIDKFDVSVMNNPSWDTRYGTSFTQVWVLLRKGYWLLIETSSASTMKWKLFTTIAFGINTTNLCQHIETALWWQEDRTFMGTTFTAKELVKAPGQSAFAYLGRCSLKTIFKASILILQTRQGKLKSSS